MSRVWRNLPSLPGAGDASLAAGFWPLRRSPGFAIDAGDRDRQRRLLRRPNAQQTLDPEAYDLFTDERGAYVALQPGQSWPSSYRRATADAVAPATIAHYVGGADLDRPGRMASCFSTAAWEPLGALRRRHDPVGLFAPDTQHRAAQATEAAIA